MAENLDKRGDSGQSVDEHELKTAGRVALVGAALAFFALGAPVFEVGPDTIWAARAIGALTVVVGVYALLAFRRLLVDRFADRSLDFYLYLTITLAIIAFLLGFVQLSKGRTLTIGDWLVILVPLVPVAIVNILLGRRVINLGHDLYGLKLHLGTLNVAMGVLVIVAMAATFGGIVWPAVAFLVASLAADIVLAMIFFRAATERREVGEAGWVALRVTRDREDEPQDPPFRK